MMFDLIIKGGLIYDGTGSDPFHADIGISGDKIVHVGQIPESDAAVLINASGLTVTPGFIDSHAHSDFTLIADPRAVGKISQGITTEINGNCGMSGAPLVGRALERREDDLKELGIRERWSSVSEYRDLIRKRGSAVNFRMLAGHGNIRGAVVGYDDRAASGSQIAEMAGLLEKALNEGASGLSTGLIYPPGIYSDTDELISLAGVLRRHGAIYTSHMRSEGDRLHESISEVIRIGRDTGVRVHISHVKTAGISNWHKAEKAIGLMENARSSGTELTCDRYPYIASSTDLDAIFPQWMFDGGNDMEIRRLSDPETRRRLRAELTVQAADSSYWDRIVISSVAGTERRWMEGMTVTEISRKKMTDEIETVMDILADERLRVGAVFFSMNEENLKKFLLLPYCAVGSDSSARCLEGPTRLGKPHPRTFGTFPRFIREYVLGSGLMSLPEAVRRMTMLPASIFGIEGRGCIREGMFADLTVIDQDRIRDAATFSDPYRTSEGICHVLVNGIAVLTEGVPTDRLPGRMI